MTLTGDPRRWANEPGIVGVVRYPDTHRWGEKEPRPVAESLQGLEDVIRYEGAHTIAAVFLETIVGTNGILIPPDGYIQGVREICDRNNILMVADEVMAGFGRTGRWFAVDHWDTVPDLMTMAKGLTSSYLPLGAVAMRHDIAEPFEKKMYYGGLTYSSHPVSLAAALATISVYEEDDLHRNARPGSGRSCASTTRRSQAKHPSVGSIRNLGLFGILDLVRSRDPSTPLTPFNGTSDEMKAIGKYFREHGLYTMVCQQLDPHQPAAVHHRGRSSPRASRSSTAPSTSPTRRSARSREPRSSGRWGRPPEAMPGDGVGKVFGSDAGAVTALDGIDLRVEPGEFVQPDRAVGLRQVDPAPDHRRPDRAERGRGPGQRQAARQARLDRDYGMVFQAPVLMDWRTVAGNVELPLELMGVPRRERVERSAELLHLVELDGLAERHPWQLSGGMQQRVAIARALAAGRACC